MNGGEYMMDDIKPRKRLSRPLDEAPTDKPATKTRLRRGDIPRDNTDRADSAEIIDFLPAVQGEIGTAIQTAVEEFLCDFIPQDLPLGDLDPGAPNDELTT
jgi:hypothetical protein